MSPSAIEDRDALPIEAETTVDGITSEGAGVGRLPDGRAVFVHRTAPGDRARIEVTRSSGRWARGRVTALHEAGPHRRPAPCPIYARCGGCTLQHLEYPAQLEAKGTIVREALRRIGKRDDLPAIRFHRAPEEFGYRNRLTFSLRRFQGERVIAGFHALDRPDRIVDVDEGCLLAETPILDAWRALRASWGPGANLLPAGLELRLTLRATANGEILLLIVGGDGGGDLRGLLRQVPTLAAIWVQREPESSEPLLAAGKASLTERWLDESFRLGPAAFLQVNRRGAELLHGALIQEMGEVHDLRVLDAYCGSGALGRWASRNGARTVGIESEPTATRIARELGGSTFVVLEGRVEDRIAEALPADIAVLNPPRAGTGVGVMEALAEAECPRILYVSCDPATLARDLTRLGMEYRIRMLQVFDLFPQTARVETLATLERTGG